ncbi:DDE family transposase [Actinokineospora auranticolor]|uniref:DDE family transposase n=1 Tax=Actinokineospora auranticolor TaxID=155976 RepID=A0A2S6GDM9_9PSEU|nr:DDE family transposase [Actinokineospora auranticolor]
MNGRRWFLRLVEGHRWVVERTLAWLTNGYRRLTTRRERHARNYLAFTTLAAALTCFKKLPT